MRVLLLVCVALLVTGCREAEYETVVEVLSCTDAAAFNEHPKCRVAFGAGRGTVYAPVAAGDKVARWSDQRYWGVLDR